MVLEGDNEYYPVDWYFWPICLIIFFFVYGGLGSVQVLQYFTGPTPVRNAGNVFACNGTVADTLAFILCILLYLINIIIPENVVGTGFSNGLAYAEAVSTCVSCWTLAGMAIEKCYALYQHPSQPYKFTRKLACAISTGIWIGSCFVSYPAAFSYGIVPDPMQVKANFWISFFAVVNFFLSSVIPLSFVFFTCLFISCVSWCRKRKNCNKIRIRVEKKVLFHLALISCCSFLPEKCVLLQRTYFLSQPDKILIIIADWARFFGLAYKPNMYGKKRKLLEDSWWNRLKSQ